MDQRLAAVDLVSGAGSLPFGPAPESARFVRYVRAPLLIQVGTHDEEASRARLPALIRAAHARTSVRWYDAGHALNARATRDFLAGSRCG